MRGPHRHRRRHRHAGHALGRGAARGRSARPPRARSSYELLCALAPRVPVRTIGPPWRRGTGEDRDLGRSTLRLHRVRRRRRKWLGAVPALRRGWNSSSRRPAAERAGGATGLAAREPGACALGEVRRAELERAAHRHRRTRPRARRRPRRRRGGADRRRPGHRQVDAAAAGAALPAARPASALVRHAARNRPRRSRCARAGSGSTRAGCSCWPRSSSRGSSATLDAEQPRGRGDRLDPDRVLRRSCSRRPARWRRCANAPRS